MACHLRRLRYMFPFCDLSDLTDTLYVKSYDMNRFFSHYDQDHQFIGNSYISNQRFIKSAGEVKV